MSNTLPIAFTILLEYDTHSFKDIFACEVSSLLCVNDEEKSGVVLGYFLCISQLSSQKAKRPFFPPVYSMLSQSRLSFKYPSTSQESYALIPLVN